MDSDALTELRNAREALYRAVVTLPFVLSDARPDKDDTDALESFVTRCRDWHNDGVAAFNNARMACSNRIDARENALGFHFPLTSLIDVPKFGDNSFARIEGDAFASESLASFENRCKREDYLPGEPVRDHQAARLCLDVRRRALDFCEWLDKAIARLESALLPSLRIGDTIPGSHNRVELHVVIMGRAQPVRPIRSTTEAALTALRDKRQYDFGNSEYIKRFRKDVPELERHLIVRGGCIRALPEAMIGRIE